VNKVTPKTPEKVAPKRVYKISIEFLPGGTSRITRKDLPQLINKTDKSVAWLEANDFKEEDIELIGTVPDCWETYYPTPVVEPDPPLAEKIAEVLDAVVAEAVTEKDAEAIADIAAPVAEPIVTETPSTEPAKS
jgi:hypothetical protein